MDTRGDALYAKVREATPLLTDQSRGALDQANSVFVEFPKTAIVAQGHTDATGSETNNQDLSERRAGAVKSYLVSRGVDNTRIVALGFGESEPIADNTTAEGRRYNRRVALLIKAKTK